MLENMIPKDTKTAHKMGLKSISKIQRVDITDDRLNNDSLEFVKYLLKEVCGAFVIPDSITKKQILFYNPAALELISTDTLERYRKKFKNKKKKGAKIYGIYTLSKSILDRRTLTVGEVKFQGFLHANTISIDIPKKKIIK